MSGAQAWHSAPTPVVARQRFNLERGRKVHLAKDAAASDIRVVELTSSSDGDSPVLPKLLGQIPEGEDIGTVTADCAHDTRRCHTAIIDREATAAIPIRKKRTAMEKGLRCGASDPDCKTPEVQILINPFNALGTAEIVRMA